MEVIAERRPAIIGTNPLTRRGLAPGLSLVGSTLNRQAAIHNKEVPG